MNYLGQSREGVKACLDLLGKLWPRWKTTPELNSVWADVLRQHPQDVCIAVIRAHRAERDGAPSMPKIVERLESARKQAVIHNTEGRTKPYDENEPQWPPRHWGDVQHFHRTDPAMVENWLDHIDEYEAKRYRWACQATRAELWAAIRANFAATGTSWSKIKEAANAGGAA